mgnify:CR=1 FL=1
MKREYLIRKWLDNELNAQELEAFKQLDDYDDLIKLSESVKHFKAPDFDNPKELQALLQKIKAQSTTANSWLKPLLRIAAIVVLFFGAYYFIVGFNTTIQTNLAEKTAVTLPDQSQVQLNAASKLSFNKTRWNSKRAVKLQGEAYFKVAKGAKFDVVTKVGTVSVFGTQFNVKQRPDFFEVICFEGSVGVKYQDQKTTLKPGHSFLVVDGKLITRELETRKFPSWIHNESYFKSLPFKEVLKELERQYNVRITVKNIDTSQLFTGTFKHDNLDVAVKSIALPLHLNYQINDDKTIVLSRE